MPRYRSAANRLNRTLYAIVASEAFRKGCGVIGKKSMKKKKNLRYHHVGIPTTVPHPDEIYLADYKLFHRGYEESLYSIEWMRYEKDCPLPELVKQVPHVAFEVDDLYEAIKGKNVIIQPNSPSEGVMVAFIEENGAPIELIQEKKTGWRKGQRRTK